MVPPAALPVPSPPRRAAPGGKFLKTQGCPGKALGAARHGARAAGLGKWGRFSPLPGAARVGARRRLRCSAGTVRGEGRARSRTGQRPGRAWHGAGCCGMGCRAMGWGRGAGSVSPSGMRAQLRVSALPGGDSFPAALQSCGRVGRPGLAAPPVGAEFGAPPLPEGRCSAAALLGMRCPPAAAVRRCRLSRGSLSPQRSLQDARSFGSIRGILAKFCLLYYLCPGMVSDPSSPGLSRFERGRAEAGVGIKERPYVKVQSDVWSALSSPMRFPCFVGV